MKNLKAIALSFIVLSLLAFSPIVNKLTSQKTHISFFSTTPVEDITANNYKSVSTLDISTGEVVFSVPMQSFEFEKALMQKHFNGTKFLNTKANPKAKLVGKIVDTPSIDFNVDGTYDTSITGKLTINGTTKDINENISFTVSGGNIKLSAKFTITLADYDVVFIKGKPSKNIAKTVEITVLSEYSK
jgi:polyisoprenoid-binding protein YceI